MARKVVPIFRKYDKNSVLQGKNWSLKVSIALKLGSKQTKRYKGMHL